MTQLSNSAEFSIQEQEMGDRERRSTLTIIGTQPSDAGAYDCRAVNEPGTTAEQATLTVHGELCIPVYIRECGSILLNFITCKYMYMLCSLLVVVVLTVNLSSGSSGGISTNLFLSEPIMSVIMDA